MRGVGSLRTSTPFRALALALAKGPPLFVLGATAASTLSLWMTTVVIALTVQMKRIGHARIALVPAFAV